MTTDATQSWLDAVTRGSNLPAPLGVRGRAAQTFAEQGLPHRRMEDWKYTDIRTRLHEALPPAQPLDSAGGFSSPLEGLATIEICFGNGYYTGTKGAVPDGVAFQPLGQALHSEPEALGGLGKGAAPEGHPLLALNTALMRDGAVIRVGEGVKAGTILIVHDGRSGRQMIRNLITLEAGAEATIIETHLSGEEAQQIQQVSEIFVGEGAKLTHVRLQDAGRQTVFLATDLVDVAARADYRGFVLTPGGELARQESFIEFSGENAEAHISGAYMLSGNQHSDITTRVNHAVPNCVSREVFKGVVADTARGVFQGKIIVAEDAQKTDGHMLNKTLLLSDKAEMDAKPELEIYADDVKCSHGATTGQLDADQLFYMRARGLDEATARGLLMQSFLAEALAEVEDEQIREALQARVNTWLGAHADAWRRAA